VSEQRPVVRLERHLDHPIERVWRAVTEPAELARWFVAEANWKPELGETFEAAGSSGRITACDPPRHFAWDWDIQSFSFQLEPEGDGTRLVFTHVFDPKLGPAEQHEGGWRAYFARLDAHLAGGFLSEEAAHEQVRSGA
jgi:uncharacterized protein YndB with AHSA1/START domain